MARKMTPTTKTVEALFDLYREDRLDLTPDFQRNSVWPPKAKAYLIDTILTDMPVPMLFLERSHDMARNRLVYRVTDGQQRIRTVVNFMRNRWAVENRYGVCAADGTPLPQLYYRDLSPELREQLHSYSFVVTELSGFSRDELREVFIRFNRYVVQLNPQEVRDARPPGPFRALVDAVMANSVWFELELFGPENEDRKRDREFIAELLILYLDGPQDERGAVDLYYAATVEQLPDNPEMFDGVLACAELADELLDAEGMETFSTLSGFYALMGALYPHCQSSGLERLSERLVPLRRALVRFALLVSEMDDGGHPPTDAQANDPWWRDAYQFHRWTENHPDSLRARAARIEALVRTVERTLSDTGGASRAE